MIYFDHNSTTPYSPSVRRYIEQGILEDWYNPSSTYSQAQTLHQKMRECRKFIADYLNCSPKYLFFTSGGTESINTILSLETLKRNQLSTFITSHLEHHATIKKIDYLSDYQNIRPYWTSNNEQGEINLENLEKMCSKHPYSLLSFLSANNETGVITNIQAISKIAKKYNCLVHVDAVQSLGKMPVDLEKWDVDFASFSGHKMGAMKGVGLLYARKPFASLMYGGGQERGLRPGTQNYPAIQSFKLAVQDIDLNKQEYVKQLRDYFENTLAPMYKYQSKDFSPSKKEDQYFTQNDWKEETFPFKINCKKANRLSNTSSIYCGMGISNQAILLHLVQKGICVSAGSACNAGSPEPSHVITALGICDDISLRDYARSCIRISLSPSNTKQEIDFLIQTLKELVSPASYLRGIPSRNLSF
ncbi:MAG: cysteine desulfurase family protein [Bdellovibrionales bacterium]|nr:cysteine desulfurase family protein [Bdellovibrionales bacterium]